MVSQCGCVVNFIDNPRRVARLIERSGQPLDLGYHDCSMRALQAIGFRLQFE